MENKELCWKCQALLKLECSDEVVYKENDEEMSEEGKTLGRTITTPKFTEMVAAGCSLCQRLMHIMGASMQDSLQRLSTNNLTFEHAIHLKKGHPASLSTIVNSGFEDEESGGDEIKSFMDLYPTAELEKYMNYAVVERCTDSESTWSLISNWLTQCSSTHKSCATATKQFKPLPSRLIDVTPGQPLRLFIVSKPTRSARYTTLSHCWGSQMPLRLLSSNIASLQKEISSLHLSKTFQDAIAITRRLGIRYIWIDSLCIIQDSSKDWQEQSATMGRVYSNSWCNIAAENGTFGCFNRRNPSFIEPLQLDLEWGPDPGSYYAVQSSYWQGTVSHAPLNMRAWVFQERMLAPRNLFFGTTEVSFECPEAIASEHFPTRVPRHVSAVESRDILPHVAGPSIRKSRGLELDPSLDAFSVWGQLIDGFSRGHLTYATDKLSALSAIASEMQAHIKSEYLAGMWRQHFAYQLLWEVRGIQWLARRGRPNDFVAPSWSWASVVGRVENACDIRFADDREIVLEILDVHVKLVNPANPFGQVKSGSLRVMGSLAQGTVLTRKSKFGEEHLQLSIDSGAFSTVILDNGDEAAQAVNQQSYFLPVRYLPRNEGVVHHGVSMTVPHVCGIVLRQTCCLKGVYTRIGKFEDFGNSGELQFACRQFAAQVDNVIQETEGWGPRHVLTIL